MLHHAIAPTAEARSTVLHARGLTGGPGALALFHQVDVRLPAGVSALVGDEGVGKTSLMRLLAGDLAATAGEVWVGEGLVPLSRAQADSVLWLDLRLPMHDEDTPEAYWTHLRQHLPNWSPEIQLSLVTALQLTPHLGKRLNMLSTGSRRKVGLVAALASGSVVTLVDQPFASLDKASIHVIQDTLRAAAQHPRRAWLIADYEPPTDVPLASVLTLDTKA